MTKTHFEQLSGYASSVNECCVTCGGRDTISTMMWQCSNPECGDLIVDMASTTASFEQINEVVNRPYTCCRCKVTAYPEELYQCSTCEQTGAEAKRATLFDVALSLRVQKTSGTGAAIQIMGFKIEALPAKYAEMVSKAESLEKRFTPYSLEQQSKLFNYTPPVDSGDGSQHTLPK